MHYSRPAGLLAGFHANQPIFGVPELLHIGEQWAPRQYVIPAHVHEVWEFYLQISGETRWDGPQESYTLTAGHFFAAPPGVPHQLLDPAQSRHHFFFAAFDLNAIFERLPALEFPWRRTNIVHIPQGETLLAPFRHLIREVSLTLSHRDIGVRLAMDSLLVEATRLLEMPPITRSLVITHPSVLRAKEMLEHQPERDWRLTDLAAHAGLSPNHLVEKFRLEIGVAPHQYLLQVRIDRAREMLTQTEISITDLALELGFSSSQHFAATFKRLTGHTAQQYRTHQSATAPPRDVSLGGAVLNVVDD